MTLNVAVDLFAEAAYIKMGPGPVARTEEVSDKILIDLDEFGVVVGLEVLSLDAEIPFTRLTTDFHIHSNVVEHLRGLYPSVGHFMSMTTGTDGVAARPVQFA